MGREDRQDINKLRKAGSDVPARGKGVKDVDTSKGKKGSASADDAERPSDYKGSHRRN